MGCKGSRVRISPPRPIFFVSKHRIDIIGGGISGLATAYFLSRDCTDIDLHLWEREVAPGGLAGTFSTSRFSVEKFYHHTYRSDVALQELLREIGLGDQLEWRPAITGSYYARRSYRLSTPLDLLRYSPLPFFDRLRLAKLVVSAKQIKNWEALDDETAREYVTRCAGENVYRLFWEPLLVSKFGKDAGQVSAAWLWSKFVDRGGSRDRTGHEVLGYLRGGLGKMFRELAQRVEQKGHHIHLGKAVKALHSDGREISEIETEEGRFRTDVVISAAQLPDLISILPESMKEYRASIQDIRFLANVCLILSLRQPLSSFYWTNIKDPSSPFVGIIEHSNWVDPRDVDRQNIAYISAYVPATDPRLKMNAAEILTYYLPWLEKMFPRFSKEDVLESWFWTANYAQPIVTVGYRKKIPSIQTPIPNFFLCTMAQIFPHDRQVSNGVDMAKKTVSAIMDRLR